MHRGSRPGFEVVLAGGIAVAILQLASCGGVDMIKDGVAKVNETVSQAVKTLENQSASWQTTLQTLESQLTQDAGNLETQVARDATDAEKGLVRDLHGLIRQVELVAKDGGQFVQESANCQADIFNSHARIALQNMLNTFLNKYSYQGGSDRPAVPHVPIICTSNMNGINVGNWNADAFLALSGTDLSLFQSQPPDIVVLKGDGSESTVPNVGNRVTNYRFEINVQPLIAQGLLKDAVQLQVRWGGQRVNRNEIPIVPCGPIGKPCCRGTCDAGACVNHVCEACGALGQHCCTGGGCPGNTCVSGICTVCGGIDQACCHGRQCNTGTCLNLVCTACGDPDLPCCSGARCSIGNTCVGRLCKPLLPECQWTADFSEEGVAEGHCPPGSAMAGAGCFGGKCDNIALYCCPYSSNGDAQASRSWSEEFSEEGNGWLYGPDAASAFVSGLHCSGNNCDNLRMEFITTTALRFLGQCIQGEWFSEENPNHRECPPGSWVGGMACRGNNCDDLSLFCCRGEPMR